MAMIRGNEAGPMAARGAAMDLGDLARRASVMRQAAIAEAERIIADAVAKAEVESVEIRARAAEEGRAEGLERGLVEGREQGRREAFDEAKARLGALEAAWADALSAFEARREGMLVEAKRDVLDLAVEIGRRVTKRVARSDPGVAVEQAREAIALVARPTRLRVAVHPDDLSALREAMPSLMERFAGTAHAELRPDPSLDRGSCVVETDRGGTIDASIGTQLERIAAALTGQTGPQAARERGERGERAA
ncbi:MAG: hypothetical protein KJZ54_06725 [Phycisphaerales bacterium]|nr:hypothetical protein [Phycisphaerales bacterium]